MMGGATSTVKVIDETTKDGVDIGCTPELPLKHGRDLSWSNVNFVVGEKSVLKDCWGEVKAGQVCALFGPSGAGKSSLLNVLAGRSASTAAITISGAVKVGGKAVNPVAFRKQIAYVMQDDSLMATTTPREALRFSAYLRLPAATSQTEIHDRVENLLKDLGLLECADVFVGDENIKGLSGGQRKRTSVGVELITDPTLLFLDEPTTGLDSFSAFNLIKLLNNISSNCAILCTIHQPSSDIFGLFDKVVFMKEGRIFYQGGTHDMVYHYEQLGYPCPENHNPADFLMNLIQSLNMKELEEKELFQMIPLQYESERHLSQQYVEEKPNGLTISPQRMEGSFLKQLYAITLRGIFDIIRNRSSFVIRVFINIILGLLFGLIFMNVGTLDNGDADEFNSHVGAISMTMVISMYFNANGGLLAFPMEKIMMLREYTSGTYDLPAYFCSKFLIEIPYTLAHMFIFYILLYFLMDLQGDFILFVMISWLVAMSVNSLAILIGCLASGMQQSIQFATLLFVPQMLFGGYYIRTDQIPPILRWANYLCGLKYGMNLGLYNEFHPTLSACHTSDAAAENCAGILNYNSIAVNDIGLYAMSLVLLLIGYRILGMVVLYQKAKTFY